MTATENSAPAGSQTDCTCEHVKNHGTAIFHGKAECYINVISAVLLKESAGQQWKCRGVQTPKSSCSRSHTKSRKETTKQSLGVAV